MRPLSIAIGASALALLAAPNASAATVCVQMPPPASGCANNQNHNTLTQGFGAANALPGRDEIRIGPVTLNERALHSNPTNNPVDIIGSGQGADGTVMRSTNTQAALVLAEASSTVSNMRFIVPAGMNVAGLDLNDGTAHDVTVVAEPGVKQGVGISLRDGPITVRNVTVLLEPGNANFAIFGTGGGTYTIEDSLLTGQSMVNLIGNPSTATVRRVRTTVPCSGACIYAFTGQTIEISDSLLLLPDSSSAFGLWASNGTINARNLTIVGNGGTGAVGVRALGSPGGSASATVLDSIIWNVPGPLNRWEMGGPASISADYSDFDLGLVSTTGPAAVTLGPNNIEADPRFANPAGGDFSLATGSPVVERGSPLPLATQFDLARAARLNDGDGNGTPVVDMGAYEYQGPPFELPPLGGDGEGPRMSVLGKRLRLDAKGRVKVTLNCPASKAAACSGRVTLASAKKLRADGRRRAITLGRKAFAGVLPGRRTAVRLKLSRKSRRLVRRLRKLPVKVSVTATDQAGNTGVTSRRLPLRARR